MMSPPGIDAQPARGCDLLGRRIADPEREVESAVRIVRGDPVRAFGNAAIALPPLGPGITAADRDAELADEPALAIDGHAVRRLVDADEVDRAGRRRLAAA